MKCGVNVAQILLAYMLGPQTTIIGGEQDASDPDFEPTLVDSNDGGSFEVLLTTLRRYTL